MRRFFAARKREQPAPAPSADAAPSSASSSSGSTDHAQIAVALPTPKRTWKPWTAAKRSLSIKSSRSRTNLPDWSNAPPMPHQSSDPDDDSDEYDSSQLTQSPVPAPPPPDPARAQHVLRVMLANTASSQPSVSPFIQQPDGLVYPRSINLLSRLSPPPADTRVAMLTKHLASRLHAADLSPAEIADISPLAYRPLPVALPPTSHPHDSSRPSTTTKILPASPGLRRWIARPCFEDRYVIYSPSASGIDIRPISSSCAIAALEYPEHLDVMVNPDFDQSPPSFNLPDDSPPLEPTLAATHSHASTNDHALVSAPAHSRNSYTAVPSPLRNEHPPVAAEPTKAEDAQPAPKLSTVKRVVRFQEDDSDDGIPLHIVRMKKKRDEKTNFLRQEQLKRAREEDFARRKEAQRILQETTEKERQRLALEKERKDKEMARYAEQVLEARARRELSRAGGGTPSSIANSSLLLPSSSSLSLRDAERNNPPPSESRRYSRVNHDAPPSISIPRREASEQVNSHPNKRFSDSSSPDSSRPPSLAYSPGSPAQGHSRPPSTYSAHTSSSEDVRHQSGSKRNSLAPSATSAPYARPPIIANYANWSGSNPNLQYIPPVPPFPDFITDMPLLPPAAPFMKHARPRSTSSSRKDSSPGPSTSSSRRGSMNSSTERVNLAPKSAGSASSSRNPSSSPRPPQQRHASTPSKPTHERRLSSDSRATAQTQRPASHYHTSSRPIPVTSRSHPVLNRGRSEQPAWPQAQAQFMQVPMNPWMTGMPMAVPVPMSAPAGMPYMAMPVYPMMPMMTGGSQTGLHGAAAMNMNMNVNAGMGMGTPRRDGGSQGRRAGEKWAAAIS